MFTCRQCSVVDYFICTYSFLCYVEHLQVLDFSTLYSDVHSPLSLCTLFSISETAYEKDSGKACVNVKKIRKWDSEKEQQFIDTIDKNKLNILENEISFLETSILSKENVNKVVDQLNSIILESAEKVFGTYKSGQEKSSKARLNKPWFNKVCWEKRKCFRIAMRRYKFIRNEHNRSHMKKLEREYKKRNILMHLLKKHRKEIQKKMDELRNSNSKEFWTLLNTRKRAKGSNISINLLFEFF